MHALRPYQDEALEELQHAFRAGAKAPLVVMPTGSGKSLVIAELIRRTTGWWPGFRVLVLAHVRELIAQNHDRFVAQLGGQTEPTVGIYSAGLKERVGDAQVTFGSIQSIAGRDGLEQHYDLVVIDEAHLVPKKGAGRYRQHIEALRAVNPGLRIAGFTATHYRLDGGLLHMGDGAIFDDVAVDVPMQRLIEEGYLVNLRAKRGEAVIDTEAVRSRGGDYILKDLERAARASGIVEDACREIKAVAKAEKRKSWLVFAVGVEHAHEIESAMTSMGVNCRVVLGTTDNHERDEIVGAFADGKLTCLVNVGCLTTGFDAPRVDLIAMLRPTQSTSLYVQCLGRGTRPHPDKDDCLVMDYGGNVERHGPINRIALDQWGGKVVKGEGQAPTKMCPACRELVTLSAKMCPACQHEFVSDDKPLHGRRASTAAPIAWEPPKAERLTVKTMSVRRHRKPGGTDSLRVDYLAGLATVVSEWVCLEHGGHPRTLAERWWREHADPEQLALEGLPSDVGDALRLADQLACPSAISVVKEGKYHRVASREFGETNAKVSVAHEVDPEDIPF
jgi:DNA repair protein RadD